MSYFLILIVDFLDTYCLKKGIDLLDGTINMVSFTTVQACREECAKTEGCVAFTTAAGTYNTCYLKNKDHGAESPNTATISARMSCYEGIDLHPPPPPPS